MQSLTMYQKSITIRQLHEIPNEAKRTKGVRYLQHHVFQTIH